MNIFKFDSNYDRSWASEAALLIDPNQGLLDSNFSDIPLDLFNPDLPDTASDKIINERITIPNIPEEKLLYEVTKTYLNLIQTCESVGLKIILREPPNPNNIPQNDQDYKKDLTYKNNWFIEENKKLEKLLFNFNQEKLLTKTYLNLIQTCERVGLKIVRQEPPEAIILFTGEKYYEPYLNYRNQWFVQENNRLKASLFKKKMESAPAVHRYVYTALMNSKSNLDSIDPMEEFKNKSCLDSFRGYSNWCKERGFPQENFGVFDLQVKKLIPSVFFQEDLYTLDGEFFVRKESYHFPSLEQCRKEFIQSLPPEFWVYSSPTP